MINRNVALPVPGFSRPLLGLPLRFECCRYRERIVWGLTLRMIDDLLAALRVRG